MLFILIGTVILLLCIINPFKFSLLFVIYYLLFISPIDSYGIFELIRGGGDLVYSGSAFLLVFSYLIFGLYFIAYKKRFNKNIRNFIFAINVLIFLIFINSFFKSFDFLYSLSVTVFTGLIFCIIIPFIKFNRYAIFGIVFLVLIKIILSLLVIFNPEIFFSIDGSFYQKIRGEFVLDAEVNSLLSIPILDKAIVGSYGIFHNPNSLGFHSVILMSMSLIFLMRKELLLKIIGLIILTLSILGWLNSLTRGPLIFLLFSIFLLYFVKNKKSNAKMTISLIGLPLFFMILFSLFSDSFFSYLLPSSDNISVTGRYEGYNDGIRVFLDNALLGIERDDPKLAYISVPHLFFLYYAYQFGLFPSIMVFVIVFLFSLKACVKIFNLKHIDILRSFAVMLMFILLGIALTNNFTAPIIFWSLFTLALLIIYEEKDFRSV